jgi:hypothetical protein
VPSKPFRAVILAALVALALLGGGHFDGHLIA